MSLLCIFFGHKPDPHGYAKLKPSGIDGIEREHAYIKAECVRCGQNYTVCQTHLIQTERERKLLAYGQNLLDSLNEEDHGATRILAERCRQMVGEGWSPEHDDEHDKGELAIAASCYALPAERRTAMTGAGDHVPPWGWPWSRKWWKPGERIRELEKAGALIAAEIDRLKRLAKKTQPEF